MTREEIKNTPELVDFMLDKCILANSRAKVRKRLEEVCDLAIKALEQEPETGRWIVNEWGNISCSECGCTALYDKVYPGESVFGKAVRVKSTFCPTCGVKMVENNIKQGLNYADQDTLMSAT